MEWGMEFPFTRKEKGPKGFEPHNVENQTWKRREGKNKGESGLLLKMFLD